MHLAGKSRLPRGVLQQLLAESTFYWTAWCAAWSAPLPVEADLDQTCATCLGKPPTHDGIKAAVAYSDVTSHVVLRLKYGGKTGLAKKIASELKRHIPDNRDGLIVTPVPLHRSRLWARSINQEALIGKALARDNGLKFIPDLLVRTKKNAHFRALCPRLNASGS